MGLWGWVKVYGLGLWGWVWFKGYGVGLGLKGKG